MIFFLNLKWFYQIKQLKFKKYKKNLKGKKLKGCYDFIHGQYANWGREKRNEGGKENWIDTKPNIITIHALPR
jgi:hypothetical protein